MTHQNEITITAENREELYALAEKLGPEHVRVLKEQHRRQNES
jgi:hypothetical protein